MSDDDVPTIPRAAGTTAPAPNPMLGDDVHVSDGRRCIAGKIVDPEPNGGPRPDDLGEGIVCWGVEGGFTGRALHLPDPTGPAFRIEGRDPILPSWHTREECPWGR